MRIDIIIVAVCELIAFIPWAINFKKLKEIKYKLFTLYLGLIVAGELANIFFHKSDESWSNILVMHFMVPVQFIFLFYFLIYNPQNKLKLLAAIFTIIYLSFFIAERLNFFIRPTNFDSLSYGVGALLLIAAIIIAIVNIFKSGNPMEYNQNTLFWIIMGLIIYYIGSFPYQNFRNFFWSTPSYGNTAYFLHYLSQAFNCIMYLLFAYSVKWEIK
jgi:hypothetical protein